MRVAVASTFVPFVKGGGRMIVSDLVRALRQRGHEVDTIEIPFDSRPREQLEQILGLRLLHVGDDVDRLIAIRTPSYMLRHRSKVVWFIHHHRGAYDLWGTPYQDLPHDVEGLALREAIMAADQLGLEEASALFSNSMTVRDRLRRFNGLEAEVLYPPLMDTDRFRCAPSEDFVFYPSRITEHKRQWLGVEAMAHVRSDVRLVIAGAPDGPEQLRRLQNTIEECGVGDRVELISRWITEEEKSDLLSRCVGVMYIPFDEDSYGYPSLEAYHSGKPVISCTDSGGTHEIVDDGVTGLMTAPEPRALAAALDRLREDPRTLEMGAAGRRRIDELQISWDHVVSRLLA